jgi:hypothetical protein
MGTPVPVDYSSSLWLLRKLTADGRVPFRLARDRLTTWEALVVDHVLGRTDVGLSATRPPEAAHAVLVTSSVLDSVSLWKATDQPEPGFEELGWLVLPPSLRDMVEEEAAAADRHEAAARREVDAILRDWDRGGELDERLVRLADLVERVETVFVIIGRQIYSKSDAGSNTLTRDGRLEGLRKKNPDSWEPEDRLFVVAAHLLFITGRSVRFEEFNGRQLSATGLREFLTKRYANYCAATGRDPVDLHGLPLFELAGRIRDLLGEVDASALMRYRRINGRTFVKNEYLADLPSPRDPMALPGPLAAHGRDNLGVELTGDPRTDLRRMTLAAAAQDARTPDQDGSGGCGALGELLGAIVYSAVRETDSDYGMSSAVRDLAELRGARPGDVDGVLKLRKGNFFCCCLPHATRTAELGAEIVPIVWRAAQRMMYNRWHFAPGEFDRAEIPLNRHYFFPPQVPDIAEHAELHHGGHTASRVRFTIRAPGAQVWREPFTVFGHGFRGCYDIRLVRMEGPAYTMTELRQAVEHCSLVDVFWRCLAEGVQTDAFPVRPISGFDRAWYESRGWEGLRGYPSLAPAPEGSSA